MVLLGLANSRMKDYFDVAFLATRFPFEGSELARAIGATFERRQTPLPEQMPIGIADQFAEDALKRSQWIGFVRRVRGDAGTLFEAVQRVRALVWPAVLATRQAQPFTETWSRDGWQSADGGLGMWDPAMQAWKSRR
jgi:hypothetical protein